MLLVIPFPPLAHFSTFHNWMSSESSPEQGVGRDQKQTVHNFPIRPRNDILTINLFVVQEQQLVAWRDSRFIKEEFVVINKWIRRVIEGDTIIRTFIRQGDS